MGKNSKWHNNGHIGHLENLIDDSLLEIEWIFKENFHIKDPTSLYAAEEKIREATNRLSARILAHKIQQSLDDRNIQENAAELIDTMPKKFKNQGSRNVKITTSWGEIIVVKTNYFSQAGKKDKRRNKRKGLFPGLFLLGIHDHLTPKLASEISSIGVIVASYEEARQVLIDRGIFLDTKTIITVAQRYAQRAKIAQREKGYSFSDTLAGCRVIVSIDGGRIRIREKKRGPKTKKGRQRYSGAWREPKLLVIQAVNNLGKVEKSFAPFIDATMKGPDAVFSMLKFYIKKLNVKKANKILFVADGARWIWNRVGDLFDSLGLSSNQCYELLDFYHAAEHLNKVAQLQKKLKPSQRTRWFNKYRKMLLNGKVQDVIEAIKLICRGNRNKKIRTERDYFMRNRNRMCYASISKKGLPIGSGAVESAIRRVINLRFKGASIYWLRETVEAMLTLRSYYKSGRWNTLRNQVFSVQAASVI